MAPRYALFAWCWVFSPLEKRRERESPAQGTILLFFLFITNVQMIFLFSKCYGLHCLQFAGVLWQSNSAQTTKNVVVEKIDESLLRWHDPVYEYPHYKIRYSPYHIEIILHHEPFRMTHSEWAFSFVRIKSEHSSLSHSTLTLDVE